MALRSGREYLEGLRDRRSVWLDGERVADVGQHPALRGCAETLAAQFDAQAAEAQRALLTTTSPSGAPVSAAWLVPRSLDELRQRRALVEHLARQHGGTMGRPPDYVPLILLGLYAGRGLMARTQPRWAQNIERFFCECRDRNLVLSHSFADAQIDRGRPSAALGHLRIVAREPQHLVVRGTKSMATLAPFADEYLVLTPPRAGLSPEQALFFAVPVATEGLQLFARAPLAGAGVEDHPLSARFDEMDALARFDDVRVPMERVFLAEEPELLQAVWRQVNVYAYYHILIRMAVKAELFAGLGSLVAQQLGTAAFEPVRAELAEMVRQVETVRAFLRAAEADAITTREGIVMPHPRTLLAGHLYAVEQHARLPQALMTLSGQSLLTVPSAADLGTGAVQSALEQTYHDAPGGLGDRIRLFRLAHDLTMTGFGARQLLFELFNGRDLARNRLAFLQSYDLGPCEALARQLAGIAAPAPTERRGP